MKGGSFVVLLLQLLLAVSAPVFPLLLPLPYLLLSLPPSPPSPPAAPAGTTGCRAVWASWWSLQGQA